MTASESDMLDFFYRHIFQGSQDFSYAGGLNMDGIDLDSIDLQELFQGGNGLGDTDVGDYDWSSGGLGDYDWTGGGLGGFDW